MITQARARVALALRSAFAALEVPNFRRYFLGQAISHSGTWMQRIAQSWLVLGITGSAGAVGAVVGLQTLPILLFGPYGGLIADRVDKRRLILVLQYLMGAFAAILGTLTLTGLVQLWHVYATAALLGIATTFENPARHSFIVEMVGEKDLRNAVSLNSVLANLARAIGPAAGGFVIALAGTGACFLANALTFAAVIGLLHSLDVRTLQPAQPVQRARGQLRAGLALGRGNAEIGAALAMVFLIGCLAYEFEVILPVLAAQTFGVGPESYGLMTAAFAVGAILGGLYIAAQGRTGLRPMIRAAAVMGTTMLLAAVAPTMPLEFAALVALGAASITFVATGNSTVQLASPAGARGRTIALWQSAFLGSRAIGAPIVGAIAGAANPRWAMATGALACLAAAGVGLCFARGGKLHHDQIV